VSEKLDPTVLVAWGISKDLNVGKFRPEQCNYVAWRRHAFAFGPRGRRRTGARRETVHG
jgi:hypothetical protein